METPVSPSHSARRTATISRREVGMFLPTKSGLIGNSAWPRSMSEKSWMRAGRPREMSAFDGCAGGAGRKNNVVTEHNGHPLYIKGNVRVRNDGRIGNEREIVPIKRDIQFSDRDADALDFFNIFRQTLGERDAAGLDADETEIFGAVILLNDLVGNTHKRPLHGGFVHDLRFEVHSVPHPFRHFGNKKTLTGKSGQGAATRHKDTVIPSYDALPAALYRLKEVFSGVYTIMSLQHLSTEKCTNYRIKAGIFSMERICSDRGKTV